MSIWLFLLRLRALPIVPNLLRLIIVMARGIVKRLRPITVLSIVRTLCWPSSLASGLTRVLSLTWCSTMPRTKDSSV